MVVENTNIILKNAAELPERSDRPLIGVHLKLFSTQMVQNCALGQFLGRKHKYYTLERL